MKPRAKRPRYSRRDIEQAALICSAKAVDWQPQRDPPPLVNTKNAAQWIGADRRVADLAWAAFVEVRNHRVWDLLTSWAEASSALMSGWLPDDEGRS